MRFTRFAAMVTGLALACGNATAAEQMLIRVNTFPTARSLPFFVGIEHAIFARYGIRLELEFTENSRSQREGLAGGKFEVVHSAVDNAIAMIEVAKVDVVIVSGGDGGTNEFIVGRDINSFADIRGKALVTDAPNTAYALQAQKILLRHGLKDGVDYRNQAGGAFVRRAWAQANAATLENYLAGYIESLRWVLDKTNRDEAIALLMDKRKLTRSLATRSYDLMIEPGFGFNPDARLSDEGFNNVLKLRQEIEGGPPPRPEKYLDLSYYDRALKLVK